MIESMLKSQTAGQVDFTFSEIQNILPQLYGVYWGVGWFEFIEIQFRNENTFFPDKWVQYDLRPLDGVASEDLHFFREVVELWPVGGENGENENSFVGVGYRRTIKELQLTADGKIPLNKRRPSQDTGALNDCMKYICNAAPEQFHQEVGYYLFYNDDRISNNGIVRPLKMVTVPRGTVVFQTGEFFSTNGNTELIFDGDGSNSSPDDEIIQSVHGSGRDVTQKNYYAAHQFKEGTAYCGVGCVPKQITLDENIRLDVNHPTGEFEPYFHRSVTVLHKRSQEVDHAVKWW